jgi:hypothetical protein
VQIRSEQLEVILKALELNRSITGNSWTLEEMFTSERGFGITTASPLQRAICRIADGRELGELRYNNDIIAYLGDSSAVDGVRPEEFSVFSGIRTGKSLFAACLAVYATQTCDVSKLGAGEIPRVSVVSISRDLAGVIFKHIVGNLAAKEDLRELMIGEPTADTVFLRHPTGREIEIKVVAGSRAGASLVARWSAGCIFDEASRMVGAEEGVVNWDDAHDAVKGRLLPGAQIVSIGSPWAPFGPAWKIVEKYWKNPSREMVCVKAPAYALNPIWWTQERMERLKETDPDVYRTDVEAEFLEPAESMFSSVEIESAMRAAPIHLEPDPRTTYVAAMDPATRSNDWTLVVAGKLDNGKKAVVYNARWQGSRANPLSPDAVLAEIADICRTYNIGTVFSDQYAGDALRDIARAHGIHVSIQEWNSKNKLEQYLRVKDEMSQGLIELPPDPYVRSDLLSVKKRVRQNGVSIELPVTADGRHADYAPSLVMALARFIQAPEEIVPAVGTKERLEWEARRMEEQDEERYRRAKRRRY